MTAEAIDVYIQALLDIAKALESHREARSEFDHFFLHRVIRDGFLQTAAEEDTQRLLYQSQAGEEFLLWQGPVPHQKARWNGIGWIFPFTSLAESERAYELITRTKLSQKSWAGFRQWWLTCRLRLQETALDLPTNLVKIRVMGSACQLAMQHLEQNPPNLRYIVKTLLERSPASSYLRTRLQMKLVVGEKLDPYIHPFK